MYNLIERLKICWNVLTKRNYVYFGLGKNPFMCDDNGYYKGIKNGKFAEYDDIETVIYETDSGLLSLNKLMWDTIADYAKIRSEKKGNAILDNTHKEQLHDAKEFHCEYRDCRVTCDKTCKNCLGSSVDENGNFYCPYYKD